MASTAVARETVFALRREIAKIEGRLAEQFGDSREEGRSVLRRAGVPSLEWLATGIDSLDNLLGGGLPIAALTEIHGSITHGAGAAAGFAFALVALLRKERMAEERQNRPLLWVAVQDAIAEAGIPYAPGLARHIGIMPRDLLISRVATVEEALWVAEEAAGLRQLCALVIEVHGNPPRLDLTATRRLDRRARTSGRPVFLLRQSAQPWPTTAPVRLLVAPAPAARRPTLAGDLEGSIGRPAFTVTVGKCRAGLPGQFILEWNSDDRAFKERPAQDTRPLVSIPAVGSRLSAAAGTLLAFRKVGQHSAATRLQPSRKQHKTHRRA